MSCDGMGAQYFEARSWKRQKDYLEVDWELDIVVCVRNVKGIRKGSLTRG